MVRVHLRLAGSALLAARITRTSAELLGLHKQQSVLALCTATAVTVTVQPTGEASPGGPALAGRALRISRGTTGDEVALQLDGGLQLVGFAAPGGGLKTRSRVSALIDESAVVIALAA